METRVSFDKSGAKRKIQGRVNLAQKKLDSQVMKDSNYFCPQDTGALQKSVLGSVIGSGLLTWAIDYSKKMYHFKGRVSKETNPNASVKWFEVAKSRFRDKWVRLVNDEYSK